MHIHFTEVIVCSIRRSLVHIAKLSLQVGIRAGFIEGEQTSKMRGNGSKLVRCSHSGVRQININLIKIAKEMLSMLAYLLACLYA